MTDALVLVQQLSPLLFHGTDALAFAASHLYRFK